MRIPISLTFAASLLALSACGQPANDAAPADTVMNDAAMDMNASAGAGATAHATLNLPDGKAVGEATVTETPTGIHVSVRGTAMPAGTHGIHLHTVGLCEGPEFTSAGGHWNPTNRQHGAENPQGQHAGDLPNLVVAEDGTGTLDFDVAGAQVAQGNNVVLDADGTSIVLHADPDDMKTDPSGNSGGRVACGVLSAG